MDFLRDHWHDIGLFLALGVVAYLLKVSPEVLSGLLWLNLIALFLHQFEEYRWPGRFPRMLNAVMFNSEHPERYPLNTDSALLINVGAWGLFFLAAVFAEDALWLGIGTMIVSAGNFIAHTFLFNIKGRRFYNPGMFSSVFMLLPVSAFFFYFVVKHGVASSVDWAAGIALGVFLGVGLFKVIEKMKDPATDHAFKG